MKRILSLVLVLVLVLGTMTTAFAGNLDLINTVDSNKSYSYSEIVQSPVKFGHVGTNPENYLIEFNTKFYKLTDLIAATAGGDSIEDAVAGLTPVTPETPELKVLEVSAINAATVEVKYSAEVDAATATNAANYVLQRQTSVPVAPETAPTVALSADNKTATLTYAANTLKPGQSYKLYVQNVRDKDDLNIKIANTIKDISIANVAPKAVSTVFVGISGGKTFVDITFDQEVVAGTATDYVATATGETTVTADAATVQVDKKTVRVRFNGLLTEAKEYTIALPDNVANLFGKLIVATDTVKVTVNADTTKPTIVSVTQDALETNATNQVLNIKFSEPITASTLVGTVFAADLSSQSVTFSSVSYDTIKVLVPDTFELESGSTYTLRVTASDAADNSGNAIVMTTPVNKTFVAIDMVAPNIKTITVVNDKTVTVKFDENITVETGATFAIGGVATTYTVAGDTITLKTTTSIGTAPISDLTSTLKVKDGAGNERVYSAVNLVTGNTVVDEAAPLAPVGTAADTDTDIVLTFAEDMKAITGIDSAVKAAVILTVEKANGTVIDVVDISLGAANEVILDLGAYTVASGETYFITFKSTQTAVKDLKDNKFIGTDPIVVLIP